VEPEISRTVFQGRLIRVDVEAWPAGEREVVHHPGACAVVAVTAARDVVLVRQVREAVRSALLEIPAGVMDVPGESSPACAARELLEETGYRAFDVRPLGGIHTSPGFSDERIELFAAGAEPGGGPASEAGIEVVLMPFADAVQAARSGSLSDAKTVCALLRAADGSAPEV
jgi:ADP-ribose pyrophosphatase